MPNFEKAFLEIRRYLSLWTTEVKLANAVGYFNINKVSEGTAMALLNLVFDLHLNDLNREKNNYPGIDLGDSTVGKLAFQVTSQTDNTKVLSTLKTFVSHNYVEVYPNGLRFFILGNRIKKSRNSASFSTYQNIFNPKEHIYYLDDLLGLIEQIYYSDEVRFNKIRDLLKREFGNPKSARQNRSVVEFNSPLEKFNFYKRILIGMFQDATTKFVQLDCKLDNVQISTTALNRITFEQEGAIILGPSGCGKSILSQMLGVRFLEQGIAVILESKYYETDLNALFEKSIIAFGFSSAQDLFEISEILEKPILIIVDGINECAPQRRPKLFLELEKLKTERNVKLLISAQHFDPQLTPLNLAQIEISYPSLETKKAITQQYSGKTVGDKFDSILDVVSNAMEAKMVGEIAVDAIERLSRFTLAEAFFKQKLGKEKADGFLLLAHIAKILSDDISFSLPERNVEDILRSNAISGQVYEKCITSKILERTIGKISFSHEMFYNFFVVESIIRFSHDIPAMLLQLEAPKNHDKRLLIIGSISDTSVLNTVLESLADADLLNAIYEGDGGEYAKTWAERKVGETMEMIGREIDQLRYEITKNEINGIGFVEQTIMDRTQQQNAFIQLIPYRLVQGEYLLDFFALIERMDERMNKGIKALRADCKQQGINVNHGAFIVTYDSLSVKKTCIASIVSRLRSGFLLFDDYPRVSKETLSKLSSMGSMKVGQFYFIIALLRWREELQHFYPYALDLIKNKWRSTPSTLLFGILDMIHFFHRNEKEKLELIEGLNEILHQTENAWISTSIFDALSALGALDDDAEQHVPLVEAEIDQLIGEPASDENCKAINSIYNCQFDHPYASAYYKAISKLNPDKKERFFHRAVMGMDDFFFGTVLLSDAFEALKEKLCPLILRFTAEPIGNHSIPQDAFQVFLLSHVLLGRLNYPLASKFVDADSPIEKSLHATAELYYWNNRKDMDTEQIKACSLAASNVLFDQSNLYTIDILNEFRHNLGQIHMRQLFKNEPIRFIEENYRSLVVSRSLQALRELDSQKPMRKLSFRDDPNMHAISLLRIYGDVTAIELLKGLSDHPKYGKYAVDAIKVISTSNRQK